MPMSTRAPVSYLDYLDQPTPANISAVHAAHGLSKPVAAGLACVGSDAYSAWLSTTIRKRVPSLGAWNYLMYQLEARRLGYPTLDSAFASIKTLGASILPAPRSKN